MSIDEGPVGADDGRDLLSALLDGELDPAEEARVRELVAASPEVQAELAALAQVRTMVRDLPAVDPPFGFYERLLRPERPARAHRHTGAKVVSAFAAAAAAIVLIVGITPAADSVVPPVAAYAQRHQEMDPAVADDVVPDQEIVPAPAFEPVASSDLDAMGAPVVLVGDFRRMSGFRSGDGAMHLVYSDGTLMVSVYEQAGIVAWDRLPSGSMVEVDGAQAWAMDTDDEEVLVFERGPLVYTVVARSSSGTHDEMVGMATELPAAADPSMVDRLREGCSSVAARFSMGTSEP